MSRRTLTALIAAVGTILMLAWYGILINTAAHAVGSHPANERIERVERYGDEFATAHLAKTALGDEIVLQGRQHEAATATWNLNHYELGRDLARATTCELAFYAGGLEIGTFNPKGGVRVFLNDRAVSTIRFSTRKAGSFPYVSNALAPDDATIRSIELAPLDRAWAIYSSVDPSFCRASSWTMRVEVRRARWKISRIGLIARFIPAPGPLLGSPAIDALVAVIEILVMVACTYGVFLAVATRRGSLMLVLPVLAMAIAPLTHDQWDFPIWLRFVDLVAYGHGNPAAMWFGTPLWAYLPAVFAPVLSASMEFFGNGSQDLTVILLKGAMAIAATYNALAVSSFAPARLRRLIFTIVLASPIALYHLAAGYREVFAVAFALAGLRFANRGKLFLATLALAAGASVSESLLPLIFFPASLALVAARKPQANALRALLLAATAAGIIAFQWTMLVPRELVETAITSRVISYRFGGGSWYAALDSFGLLPSWVGPHSFLVVGVIFGLLVLWPARAALLAIRSRRPDAPEVLLQSFTSFVVAFFLSYRGVDPSTWYALFAICAAYFARRDPTNPLPLLLGCTQGIAFYAIVGLGDFVNWTFLWPHDTGLLGVLGRPVDALVLAGNGMTAVLYLTLTTPLRSRTFSPNSTLFVMLFLGSVANAAIKVYAADAIFCTLAGAIGIATIALMLRARKRRTRTAAGFDVLSAIGFCTCVLCGAACGASNPAAGLVASIAILLGFEGGFGMSDIVLIASSCLLLSLERGFGYYSIGGWIVLSLTAVFAIYRASRTRRTGRTPPLTSISTPAQLR